MKQVSTYTGNIGQAPIDQTKQNNTIPPEAEKAASTVNLLFKRLFVIYTSFQPTIAKNHGQNASIYLDELKAEWTKQFIAENLTVDDIKTGLERARLSKSEFMPKCSTFIDWCKGVDEQALNKSWQHYVNRRIGQEWSDAMTFETAKRLGCGCNELIANQCNNNAEKAKKLFADKYNEILTDIKNGFKLPELALVIEHKAGSNQNRSKQDKQRIEQKKAEFESGKPLEKRGKFNPDGWLMLKTGVWYKFHNGAKIHYVEESGMVHLNGKQIEISEFQKGVE